MLIIIGLGNPGKQYERTRHNVGFMAVDFLAATFDFPKFRVGKKFQAEISEGEIEGMQTMLVKPKTYMNNSGDSVAAIRNYFKLPTEELIIIYDELDLPFGELRVRRDGSSAGHNGVKSIMDKLATDRFSRVRIGVANKLKIDKNLPADVFVLSRFSFLERRKLNKKILPEVVEEVLKIIK